MTRSLMGLARVLCVVFAGAAAVEVVRSFVATLWLAGLLPETPAQLVYGGAFVVMMLATLLLVPVLAFFTWQAASNVRAREPDFYESPGGSAIAWFIPGWNLYKPYDALSSIWSATANLIPGDEPQGPGRLLELFWVAWVASIVIGRVFGGGSDEAFVGVADVVAASFSALSCVAGALVVLRIARLQEAALAA
jgi:hypothetical protein